MPTVERKLKIERLPQAVYEIIADYESYPDFLPEIRSAKVLDRSGAGSQVMFEFEMLMRVRYVLNIVEEPVTGIQWKLEEAALMKQNQGRWFLEEVDGGTMATYALDLEFRGQLPRSVSESMLLRSLERTLERFKERVESICD